MNRVISTTLAVCAVVLLPAVVAAEQKITTPPPADAAGVADAAPAKREAQPQSEPEWPQPRCEAPAE